MHYPESDQSREKTIVISTAYGLWPMLEFELDIIQRELDAGNRVIFLYCSGQKNYCPANNPKPGQVFKKRKCQECISRVKNGTEWLEHDPDKLTVAHYDAVTRQELDTIQETLLELDKSKKVKNIIRQLVNINGIDIFESAYSQLITDLNDYQPKIEDNWKLFRNFLEVGLVSYYSAQKIFQNYEPDKVYVFNGRISRYRPLMRMAQRKNCSLAVYEYPAVNFQDYTITNKNYPHDIENYSKSLRDYFDALDLSGHLIESTAIKWFNDRREFKLEPIQKLLLSGKFSHISRQPTLPDFWDDTKFNLVFFVSSQNELSSIEENINHTPFDQVSSIKFLHAKFPEIHYTIRIHPNLKSADPKFVRQLEDLANLKNVNIVPAGSQQNSYSLVDAADLILTFGSTIGVEAAFKMKPVINVGVALYSYFDCVSVCNSADELLQLVNEAQQGNFSQFPSIDKRYWGACSYAYAYLNHGVRPVYLEKESYFGGWMLRDGKRTQIKADEWIICKNRILNFGPRIYHVLSLLLTNPKRAVAIGPSNLLHKLKHAFYGDMP